MNSSEKILEEIRDLLDHKENVSIVLSNNTTKWNTTFSPPMYFNPRRKYEMSLMSLETYYSIPNINNFNNTFVYHDGTTTKTITVPLGSYELADINTEIQKQMQLNGDVGTPIKLLVNTATLKAVIQITNPAYTVRMGESTIRSVLGFHERTLTSSTDNEGDLTVNILTVNSIMVTCNLVGGSYIDGVMLPIIYSFFPDVSPGEKIVESPRNLIYLPITSSGLISKIEISLVDQNGDLLDLRGETISVRLHIRSL
jgi:hypothetical protein